MLEKEVSLLLHDYHEDYGKDLYFVLVYRNVRACRLSLEPTNYAINWARDIFEDIGDGYLLHRIMCSDDIRIDIEFSDVSLSAPKNIRRHNS
jgi:hypothetical protein